MLTPGFKFFFGLAVGLATVAVVYGYVTGGDQLGPFIWGWKGGIGDHVGYVVLMGLSVVAGVIGCMLVSFRDADPEAQADYAGIDSIAPTNHIAGSHWPVVGALGAATMVVGLVVAPVVFIVGVVLGGITVVGWTIHA